jgi:hypothetical protein
VPDLLGVAGDATEVLVNEAALVGEAGERLRIKLLVGGILELAERADLPLGGQEQAAPRQREGEEGTEEESETVFHAWPSPFTKPSSGGVRKVAGALPWELNGQAIPTKLIRKARWPSSSTASATVR